MPPDAAAARTPCRRCAGSGRIDVTTTASRRVVPLACPECRGTGETGPQPPWIPDCQRCGGSGVVQVGAFRDKPVTIGCPACHP